MKKDKFSFSVIHFTTKADNEPIGGFKTLTDKPRGNYRQIEDLAAIRINASYPTEISDETPAAPQS